MRINKKHLKLLIIFSVIFTFFVGCSKTSNEISDNGYIEVETPNALSPSIMADGELFYYTGEEVPVEPAEEEIKTIISVVELTKLPSMDGEINMPYPESKYAKVEDYVVVLVDSEWVRFERTGGAEQGSEVKSSIDLPTVEQIVTTLCSDQFEGRRTFSKGNEKAGEYITDIFAKIGLDTLSENSYLQSYTKGDVNREDYDTSETIHNIVGYIKGTDSKKAIIISAHFDGRGIRDGEIYRSAMDNASGVAALIKVAEELKQVSTDNPFESNIIFCAFNGEEQVYIGSTAFVNQSRAQTWHENMYNINIDSIGAKDGGAIMFPNDSEYSAKLYESIKNSIKNNDIDLVEFERPIASDHRSFEKVGKANICITQEGYLEWIHKPIDTPDVLDYVEIEEIAKALSDFIKNNDGTVY